MVPRVLIGPRTNDDDAVSEPIPIGGAAPAAGGKQDPPLHAVAEAADGKGPLRASRTLFLSQGVLPRDLFAGEGEDSNGDRNWEGGPGVLSRDLIAVEGGRSCGDRWLPVLLAAPPCKCKELTSPMTYTYVQMLRPRLRRATGLRRPRGGGAGMMR